MQTPKMQKDVNPPIQSLDNQIKAAFGEYMLTTFHIPRAAIPAYWDVFYKSLEWRIYPKREIGGEFNNCLFIRIPRTGSTSINSILKQTGGHTTAMQWRRKLTPEMWNRLFKFAIVRDPYTRFISAYHLGGNAKKFGDVNEHLKKYGMSKLMLSNPVVFQPQKNFIYGWGKNLLDYVGRFERLDEEWKHIATSIGTDMRELPFTNYTKEEKCVLNKQSKHLIYTTYKVDFEEFGYER